MAPLGQWAQPMFSTDLIEAARVSKSWPFQEAQRLAKRYRDGKPYALSLHQPLASFMVHGIKQSEGRVWDSDFRGELWIHAASKAVDAAEIAQWERKKAPPELEGYVEFNPDMGFVQAGEEFEKRNYCYR